MHEPILLNYKVTIYNLRIFMKKDNSGPNYFIIQGR